MRCICGGDEDKFEVRLQRSMEKEELIEFLRENLKIDIDIEPQPYSDYSVVTASLELQGETISTSSFCIKD